MKDKETVSTPYGDLDRDQVYDLLKDMVITACKIGKIDPSAESNGIPLYNEIIHGLVLAPRVAKGLVYGEFEMKMHNFDGKIGVEIIKIKENGGARVLN